VTASTAVEVHESGTGANRAEEPGWALSGQLLAAVADPVRWTVLHRLVSGTTCVCDLQAHVAVAPNLLSYHLRVLREAGLVVGIRRGRWVDYTLAPGAFERLVAALPVGGAS
jgi:ArsR family transcriptional regulator